MTQVSHSLPARGRSLMNFRRKDGTMNLFHASQTELLYNPGLACTWNVQLGFRKVRKATEYKRNFLEY